MPLAAVIALNLTTTIGVGALIANHLITVPTLGPQPSDVKPSSFIVYLLFTILYRKQWLQTVCTSTALPNIFYSFFK